MKNINLNEVYKNNIIKGNDFKKYTLGEVIDKLDYDQIAVQLIEDEHKLYEAFNAYSHNANVYLYYDKNDKLLKIDSFSGKKGNGTICIFKDDDIVIEPKFVILDVCEYNKFNENNLPEFFKFKIKDSKDDIIYTGKYNKNEKNNKVTVSWFKYEIPMATYYYLNRVVKYLNSGDWIIIK